MNTHSAALCAAVVCLAAPACIVNADPRPASPPAPPTAAASWVATDNDVFGNWKTEDGEAGNEIKFSPDHTLAVYDEGYGAIGPFVSTWKLVNNHVVIADTYQYRELGSENAHYKAPPFNAGYGNDLQVIRVNGHTVLMPMISVAPAQVNGRPVLMPINSATLAQEYGFAPIWCFWHFTIQRGYAILPQDAIDLNNAIYKRLRDAARKHKQK